MSRFVTSECTYWLSVRVPNNIEDPVRMSYERRNRKPLVGDQLGVSRPFLQDFRFPATAGEDQRITIYDVT